MCTTNTPQEVCCVPVSFYANNRNRAVGWCLLVRATILFHLWKLQVLPDDVNDKMFDTHVLPYLQPLCHMGPFPESSALFDTVILPQFRNKVRHTAQRWVVDNRVVLRQVVPGSSSSSSSPQHYMYRWSPKITSAWFGSVDEVQTWLRTLGKRNTANVDARFPPSLPTLLPLSPASSGGPPPSTPTGRRLAESVARAQGLVTPPQTEPLTLSSGPVTPTRFDPRSAHPLPLRYNEDEDARRNQGIPVSPLWTSRTGDSKLLPHTLSDSGLGSLIRHDSHGSQLMASPSLVHLPGAPPPPLLQQRQQQQQPETGTERDRKATQAGQRQSTRSSPRVSPASRLGSSSVVSHQTCNSTVVEDMDRGGGGGLSILSGRTHNSTIFPVDHYDGSGGRRPPEAAEFTSNGTQAPRAEEGGDVGLAGYSDIQLALEWQLHARRHVLEADLAFKRLMLKGNP
ncbi:hypothetical protein LZ32DRAFT_681058 [Colletotrichum eremochloae]|nr:hypothetical protein LZ32DRAFT_681058 [Colletotrichum eremochloae]